MSPNRVRQHVNPFHNRYRQPVEPPDWPTVFAHPHQPVHVDIGSAKGLFLRDMARACPDWNFVGLEIREPLVEQALQWRDADGFKNLHFIFCNANTSLGPLLASLGTQFQRASIQFPDPWFKKRHQKRRVVQPELVLELAEHLPQAGWVWLQSDVEAVAIAMRDQFQHSPYFISASPGWLSENPLPAQTDRERVTLAQGKPVYRSLFTRNAQLVISPSVRPQPSHT
ncbi:MAG: tRNA (guanosine(46)-N7)-methyltransferase TrmB [Cyanobacteria bacterium P01_A01_bin.137]